MLAQAFAVIGREDDQGVLENALGRERLPEMPDGFIDVSDFGIVAAMRVRLVRIVQMDEDERRMTGFLLDPLAGRTQYGLRGPLDLRRLLSRIGLEVKRAVVDVESPVQTEAGVQHIAADEGSCAVAACLEHSRECDDVRRDVLAVFFHAVRKRVGGTHQ